MIDLKRHKTFIPKMNEIQRKTYLIDAKDKILGRVAVQAAAIIRGKHKAIFTPHLMTGDQVVIINADKIRVTGKKMQDKIYNRYSGYPSGQRSMTLEQMLQKAPTKGLQLAIKRIISKGTLGARLRMQVKIYASDETPADLKHLIPLE